MLLSQTQIDFMNKNGWIILATSSGDRPRACVVEPLEIRADKVVIADCEMGVSNENVAKNPNVFISSYDASDMDRWIKIEGRASYITSGEEFEKTKAAAAGTAYPAKALISVDIADVSSRLARL
jgi:uncharacterized pyridoxamine 5'-phosphate oxidase family protein